MSSQSLCSSRNPYWVELPFESSSTLSYFRKRFALKTKSYSKREVQQKIKLPDTSPSKYLIKDENYKRNSSVDMKYKRKFKLALFEAFDNRCCNCGSTTSLEIDHFFIPKCSGGNFAMKYKKGKRIVNNAIVLCKQCNMRKSDLSYFSFFDKNVLFRVVAISNDLTKKLDWSELE